MKRSTVITLVVIAAVAGLAVYSTTSRAGNLCRVCLTYNGHSNCASARGTTVQDAREGAQNTACGTLASGMDQSIACGRVEPDSVQCNTH